jgi:phage-related protein
MKETTPKIPLIFYRTSNGVEPVRDWLKTLPPADRSIIGQDLMRLQFRWPVGMPLCRALGRGLWEVRSALSSNRIARVLVFVDKGRIGVLHGFIKKTQKTPADALTLADKRMKEMKK